MTVVVVGKLVFYFKHVKSPPRHSVTLTLAPPSPPPDLPSLPSCSAMQLIPFTFKDRYDVHSARVWLNNEAAQVRALCASSSHYTCSHCHNTRHTSLASLSMMRSG